MAAIGTNIKIDPALKQEAQALFESFGLSRGFSSVSELMEDLDAGITA